MTIFTLSEVPLFIADTGEDVPLRNSENFVYLKTHGG